MPTPTIWRIIKNLFSKPSTNLFPAKYAPPSILKFFEAGKINPPVPTPPGFRGKLKYDRDKCIGCGLCVRVCPAECIEMKKNKKIKISISHCAFCAQCTEVCPVKCLHMTDEFLLADFDRDSKNLTVE